MTNLDIVIVNWNSGDLLRRCLQSLPDANLDGVSIRSICIVDNHSQDGSEEVGFPAYPVDLIRSPTNLGFGAASNLGAFRGSADYILFLNPDTELHRSSLSAPVRFMEDPANRRVGICGILLVDRNSEPAPCVSRSPTVGQFLYKATGLTQFFPVACASVLLPAGRPEASGNVDQVIGAFMLVRRDLFHALDGFDKRFFVYFEDADFALRAKQLGHGSYFLREATAYHRGNGSTEKVKSLRLFYSLRSRLQYSAKHFPWYAQVATFLITTLLEPITRGIRELTAGSITGLCETISGYFRLYCWLVTHSKP